MIVFHGQVLEIQTCILLPNEKKSVHNHQRKKIPDITDGKHMALAPDYTVLS